MKADPGCPDCHGTGTLVRWGSPYLACHCLLGDPCPSCDALRAQVEMLEAENRALRHALVEDDAGR